MLAFFKIQIKLFFKQKITFIFPIAFSIIFIVSKLIYYFTFPKWDDIHLHLSNVLTASSFNNIIIFILFASASFVGSTFFYKYKNEGLQTILFSKPINRSQIYFTNAFVTTIGMLFCLSFYTFSNFISLIIVSHISIDFVFIQVGTTLLASLITSIFAIGLSLFVQALVELKAFQILIGIIPFIITAIFAIIKTSSYTGNITAYNDFKKNITLPLSSNSKNNNDNIDLFNDSIKNGNINLPAFNNSVYSVYRKYRNFESNQLNSSLTKSIDINVKNNFYSYLKYFNYSEYFLEIFSLGNKDLKIANTISSYQWKQAINNNELDLKVFQNENINLNNVILIKILDDKDETKDYVIFTYNYDLLEKLYSFFTSSKNSKNEYIDNNKFAYIKLINQIFIDEVNKQYSNEKLNLNSLNLNNKYLNISNIENIKNNLTNDKEFNDFLNSITTNLFTIFSSSYQKTNDNFTNVTIENDLENAKISLENIKTYIINAITVFLVSKYATENKLAIKINDFDTNFDKDEKLASLLVKNLITPINLKNNLVIYKTKENFNIYFAIFIPIILAMLFTFFGWLIIYKKDYK
ncbi:ABC transporter permease [Mycoplasmopsis meleagridis]|uniref:ABC transporter permease n=1 Tax=Mycoplasmopsis meleagridis TaxID=29561 RepID=UPI003A867A3A